MLHIRRREVSLDEALEVINDVVSCVAVTGQCVYRRDGTHEREKRSLVLFQYQRYTTEDEVFESTDAAWIADVIAIVGQCCLQRQAGKTCQT